MSPACLSRFEVFLAIERQAVVVVLDGVAMAFDAWHGSIAAERRLHGLPGG